MAKLFQNGAIGWRLLTKLRRPSLCIAPPTKLYTLGFFSLVIRGWDIQAGRSATRAMGGGSKPPYIAVKFGAARRNYINHPTGGSITERQLGVGLRMLKYIDNVEKYRPQGNMSVVPNALNPV